MVYFLHWWQQNNDGSISVVVVVTILPLDYSRDRQFRKCTLTFIHPGFKTKHPGHFCEIITN